jgi:hypothetical protein
MKFKFLTALFFFQQLCMLVNAQCNKSFSFYTYVLVLSNTKVTNAISVNNWGCQSGNSKKLAQSTSISFLSSGQKRAIIVSNNNSLQVDSESIPEIEPKRGYFNGEILEPIKVNSITITDILSAHNSI